MNCRRLAAPLTGGIGILFVVLGAGLGWGAFPLVVEDTVEKNIDLTDSESEGYANFITPPVPVLMKFYMFHVENPVEVVTGTEMANLTEKGPYVYREVREKVNLTYGDSSVNYAQYRHFEFEKGLSCEGCDKTDEVRILNVPLLGAVHEIVQLGSFSQNGAYNTITPTIDNTWNSTDLFLIDTVDNILFAGVMTPLVEKLLSSGLFNNKLPPGIQKNGFAIFNTKNATTYNECYQVDTSVDGHSEIRLWGPDLDNLVSNLSTTRTCPSQVGEEPPACRASYGPWWPNPDVNGNVETSPCNFLRGTNGEQFPPFLEDRKEEPLWTFQTDLCRSLYMRYVEDHDIEGIKTLRYSIPKDGANINKTENFCFCAELAEKWVNGSDSNCWKETEDSTTLDITDCNITTCYDGIQDVSECMLAQIFMSSPHFYLAEDQLKNFASGLSPSEADHMTYMDVEPITGMTLTVHKRIQVNTPIVPTGDDGKIVFLQNIKHVPVFPVVWLDEGAEIDQENIDKIKSMVTTPLLLLEIAKWGMLGLGIALTLLGGGLFFCLK